MDHRIIMPMIEAVTPERYPELLDVQISCIRGLSETYNQHEIDTWVSYLERATPERLGSFINRAWLQEDGTIGGFVSWTEAPQMQSAAIECLYVQDQLQGKGIGRLLLQKAECALAPGTLVGVRSTLNAGSFYEHNGYNFKHADVSRAGFSIAYLTKIID